MQGSLHDATKRDYTVELKPPTDVHRQQNKNYKCVLSVSFQYGGWTHVWYDVHYVQSGTETMNQIFN